MIKRNSQYRKYTRSTAGNIMYFSLLFLLGSVTVLPLIYCVVTSLKPLDELLIFPPQFFVRKPTLANFLAIPSILNSLQVPISRYTFNTIFIAFVSTFGSIIICSMAAFAFSKSNMKCRTPIFSAVQFMLLYSAATLAVPQYMIFSKMHLIDTYWVYLLPALPSAVNCFLMKQFLDVSVPNTLLEAARIDGAGVLTMYWKIVMPILKPAYMTVLLSTFQAMWGVVPGGTIFKEELKTLPYAMRSVANAGIARSGSAMAITVILMLPPIIVFLITQGNVMETMSSSGIKE